jgi:hypothetical protein
MRFILVFLLSITSVLACVNKLPLSEAVKAVALESGAGAVSCEASPSEQCLCYEGINFQYADLVDNEVLDYIAKENTEACSSMEDCDAKFILLSCGQGFEAIKNYELLEVYCIKPIMKVEGKKLVNNPTKQLAYEQAQLAKAQLASALALAEKAQVCGRSAMALLLVRNASKNLSTAQVKTMVANYASVKQLLESGSLTSAQEEISAVVADGVLITEADKSALIAHINGCKP